MDSPLSPTSEALVPSVKCLCEITWGLCFFGYSVGGDEVKAALGFWIVRAVKVALIIVYYFNGTDNPKTQSKLDGKSVVQNVTQLFLFRHLQSSLCTIIQNPVFLFFWISSEAGLILEVYWDAACTCNEPFS